MQDMVSTLRDGFLPAVGNDGFAQETIRLTVFVAQALV
jgi:hypothetical protein